MRTVYPVVTFLALAFSTTAQSQETKYIADTVTVQADATYEADPDLATLSFQVSAKEKRLARAYERATESLNRIHQLAKSNGIDPKEVTTGPFTIGPVLDWYGGKTKAYRVEANVVFRLRDFARVGGLIDQAVRAGIAEFRSLSFSLADEEDAKVRAIALARDRAETRARAALGGSGRLGGLRQIKVDIAPMALPAPKAFMRRMDLRMPAAFLDPEAAPEPPALPAATPERVRVSATVHCVFQIADTK